ncbi:MAG: hypothetical protein Q9220_006280 [cf. Caloplaca sp. 1 TL-2023]
MALDINRDTLANALRIKSKDAKFYPAFQDLSEPYSHRLEEHNGLEILKGIRSRLTATQFQKLEDILYRFSKISGPTIDALRHAREEHVTKAFDDALPLTEIECFVLSNCHIYHYIVVTSLTYKPFRTQTTSISHNRPLPFFIYEMATSKDSFPNPMKNGKSYGIDHHLTELALHISRDDTRLYTDATGPRQSSWNTADRDALIKHIRSKISATQFHKFDEALSKYSKISDSKIDDLRRTVRCFFTGVVHDVYKRVSSPFRKPSSTSISPIIIDQTTSSSIYQMDSTRDYSLDSDEELNPVQHHTPPDIYQEPTDNALHLLRDDAILYPTVDNLTGDDWDTEYQRSRAIIQDMRNKWPPHKFEELKRILSQYAKIHHRTLDRFTHTRHQLQHLFAKVNQKVLSSRFIGHFMSHWWEVEQQRVADRLPHAEETSEVE